VGYSAAKLEALRAWLKVQNTTGMLAIVGGQVLFEYGDTREVSKIASVRKASWVCCSATMSPTAK
jgi:hypothetical protein